MTTEAQKFLANLTHNANATLSQSKSLAVLLAPDKTELNCPGATKYMHVKPLKQLARFRTRFGVDYYATGIPNNASALP